MYGPSWSFEFKRGERYKLPTGYGFSENIFNGEFQHGEHEYIGTIKQKRRCETYLVFKHEDKYVFCDPKASIMGHRIDLCMNPRYFGTLVDIVREIGICEWDIFVSGDEKDSLPILP